MCLQHFRRPRSLILASLLIAVTSFGEENPLVLPRVGYHELRILSPTVLELALITSKDPDPARVQEWDFVHGDFKLTLPSAREFVVLAGGKPVAVTNIGFKRRVLYAPLKRRDLRISNALFLELARPIVSGESVEVRSPKLGSLPISYRTAADPSRWSPVIHVNQTGYLPNSSKKAMVGSYLGSLGEMRIPGGSGPDFEILDAQTNQRVHKGVLKRRSDQGFTFPSYQQVWEADFSDFTRAGEYRIAVPGLGVSFPFLIDDGIAAAFARTYALGLYHQRCGTANEFPFTRFVHRPCHTAPAEVPTKRHEPTAYFLKDASSDFKNERRHSARQLQNVNASLYPFVRQGKIDVSGGHHDAGDYSKYTINSATLIHYLVFAADAFPGAGDLDNMGLPESGDGKSDLLQEAKWEADFLVKMQDSDGGFYFLVYPRERKYEDDVLPDRGDPQVVWPKNTSATGAAIAALAQMSSSPLFRKQFPTAAKSYFESAVKGWQFLERAIAKHGRDGAYQKLTHYGHEFLHDDELAWAAAELFLATGDQSHARELKDRFDPSDRETRRWTWWRLFEAYGCAVRSYAFAARTGRVKTAQLDPAFLAKCEAEVMAAGNDQVRFAAMSAYGTSFPDPTKRFRSAGWYFSIERAFDIVAALQLDRDLSKQERFKEAFLSNINYEAGCNPVNVSCLCGLGWKRQREVVHHYAQNDRRILPPSGIPIGNVQAGFQFLHHYQRELGSLSFPPDGAEQNPYPFYDRWGDSFNVSTEFVAANQARSLAGLAWLMAQTASKTHAWKAVAARITGLPETLKIGAEIVAKLEAGDLNLSRARIVWEATNHEPQFGREFKFKSMQPGECWIEAEAQMPDGRRAFAARQCVVEP